ncbi:MAG: alpha/beta hydrolase [Rhodospirillaceae bacterium]
MTSLDTKTIDINGTKIIYRRGGKGRALLFLHGAGGAGNALGFCSSLTGGHDVIVPDHPGFGDSDMPDWLDTIHDMAFFYLDFLEALDLWDVHVVGQSLGGWIALETAIRSTERMGLLTLIGAAGLNVPGVKKGDLFMWDKETRYRTMIHDEALAAKLLAMPTTPEQDETAIKNEFTTARLAWEPRFFDPHLHKWLHRITVPTQVIWGEQDPVFPPPYGEALAARIPGAQLVMLQDCGHLPQIEKPAELSALIKGFSS